MDNVDLHNWQEWVAPLIGTAFAFVAIYMGQSWFRSRRVLAPELPPVEKNGQPIPDPFLYGSATEKRGALRRTGPPVRILIAPGEDKSEHYEAWVVDRSVGGLCLIVKAPVPENTMFYVRAKNAPEQTPWIKVEVKRCLPSGEEYELGCQFVKTPTWNVLLLFG